MKLNKIYFDNFRSKETASYPLTQINLFCGPNGSGKSTVKAAVQMALTGTNEWATSSSDNIHLIRHGRDQAHVGVSINCIGDLYRTIQHGNNMVEMNGGLIPQKEVVKYLDEHLDTNQTVLSSILDSGRFLHMDSKQQKNFILKAANLVLNQESILSYVAIKDSKEQASCSEIINKKIVEAIPAKTNIQLEDLDKYYKYFFEERRTKKKQYSALEKLLPVLENSLKPKTPFFKTIQMESKFAKDKEILLKQLGAIEPLKKQKESVEKKIGEIVQKIQKLIVSKTLPTNLDELNKLIAEKETETENLINDLDDDRNFKSYREGILVSSKKVLKIIIMTIESNAGSVCPLSDKLVCTADKNLLIKQMKEENSNAEEELKKLSKTIADREKLLLNKKDELNKLQIQKSNIEVFNDLRTRKQVLKQELENIKIPDTKDIELKKEVIEEKLAEIIEAKKNLAAIEQKEKEIAENKKLLDSLSDEIAALEYLVKKFGPGAEGLKAIIVKRTIDPIEDYINETLKVLGNGIYSLKFVFSPDFNIIVNKKEKVKDREIEYAVPYKFLSESELDRLGFVMADAINTITNAKMICFDELDKIDEENAEFLVDFLNYIKDNYDTMLLMGTYGTTVSKVEAWVKNQKGNVYKL